MDQQDLFLHLHKMAKGNQLNQRMLAYDQQVDPMEVYLDIWDCDMNKRHEDQVLSFQSNAEESNANIIQNQCLISSTPMEIDTSQSLLPPSKFIKSELPYIVKM